jgi:hypothetical protein
MVNQPAEVTDYPASPQNYTEGREGNSISVIVLHKEQGTLDNDTC